MRYTPMFVLAVLLVMPFGTRAAADQKLDRVIPTYTERGADTCLKCHDEFSDFPVMDIFKTKHAQMADPRSPMAKLQCETCHGPGLEHGRMDIEEGQPQPPIRDFGAEASTPVAEQNAVCLSCHDDRHRADWRGSAHQNAGVSCAQCHKIHTIQDAVLSKQDQAQVCFKCHTRERAESYGVSAHPLRNGSMTCSSCHEPHGSLTRAMLRRTTVNQTCYQCHAEKRGPFLWEHAPVSEDCTLCHRPHGSNSPALLTERAPLLCQQCHSQTGHPSVALDGSLLPGSSPLSNLLLGRSCMNCHPRVHGSNHPSGVNLKR